jgi:hypothetical protein
LPKTISFPIKTKMPSTDYSLPGQGRLLILFYDLPSELLLGGGESSDSCPTAGMAVSAFAARSNGFNASFAALFGLWTIRPRVAVATLLWSLISYCISRPHHNSYNWTLKDMVVAESLLNMLAVPFAIHFMGQSGDISPACEGGASNSPVLDVHAFYNCLIVVVVVGCASFFLLNSWLLLHFMSLKRNDTTRSGHYEYRYAPRLLKITIYGFGKHHHDSSLYSAVAHMEW